MRARLWYVYYQITSSLWFVPGLLIVAAIVLAFTMLALDAMLPSAWLAPLRWLLRIGPEGARQLLATIAGSMITVASLVFSMTLVVLTLASSQLGPRLIARFTRDTVNQIGLGSFVATFVYALLILETVNDAGGGAFVPHLSVTVALLLALINLFWLIYLIHHVADSIQADSVIAELGAALRHAIDRRFPDIDAPPPAPLQVPFLDRLAEPPGIVGARQSGYVQTIDSRALLRGAREHDLVIRIGARPGDFLVAAAPLLEVWPAERLSDELADALAGPVVIGPKRTAAQDIDFAISALVEIALRALSPGINDPHTALTCIDRLTEALVEIIRRGDPPALVQDADGALRLIVRPADFAAVLGTAFNPVRHAGRDQAIVLRRLAEVAAVLAGFVAGRPQLEALERQAAALQDTATGPLEPLGRTEVDHALETLRRALAEAGRRLEHNP